MHSEEKKKITQQHFVFKHYTTLNCPNCVATLTFVYLSSIPVGLTVILAVWSSPYFQFECNRHTRVS